MKVKDLIELLKKYDPELSVVHELYSEQLLVEEDDFSVEDLCLPRPDGWVQNKRRDMPCQKYLVIEGN